jgi:poly(hydroxyalkanoate) granule-associated protein
VAKKLKDFQNENQIVKMVKDSAHQIWLAGLGAFSKAQEEGSKLFEVLVKEGQEVEARTKKVGEEGVEEARAKTSGTWDKLEQVFEDRVSRALNQLGVPTRNDIQELAERVEELSKNVKELTKMESSPSKGVSNPPTTNNP